MATQIFILKEIQKGVQLGEIFIGRELKQEQLRRIWEIPDTRIIFGIFFLD
mgnify:CR=1 FL=1